MACSRLRKWGVCFLVGCKLICILHNLIYKYRLENQSTARTIQNHRAVLSNHSLHSAVSSQTHQYLLKPSHMTFLIQVMWQSGHLHTILNLELPKKIGSTSSELDFFKLTFSKFELHLRENKPQNSHDNMEMETLLQIEHLVISYFVAFLVSFCSRYLISHALRTHYFPFLLEKTALLKPDEWCLLKRLALSWHRPYGDALLLHNIRRATLS